MVREPAVVRFGFESKGIDIVLERGERRRDWLEGVNASVANHVIDEQRKHPDIRTHVKDAITVSQRNVMTQIVLVSEDLFVQMVGLVFIQLCDLDAVR